MIISHLKIIAFQLKRIAMDVLLLFTEFCLYNKQKNTWVLGNTRFNSRVEHDIIFNTQNTSGISAHSCIILYIFYIFSNHNRPMYKYCVFLRRVVTIFDTIGTARLPVYIAWVLRNSL